VIEGEGLAKGPHHIDLERSPNDTSTVSMELDGGLAEVVVIRCHGWRFTFYVDPNPAPGLLRDLADSVDAIVSAAAA
jgi:hypothetical protein